VLVSSLITDGRSRQLLEGLLGSEETLLISEPILDEFLRVTSEKRLSKYIHDDDVTRFLMVLLAQTSLVRIRSRFKALKSPDDNILRTAKDGRADIIVSGDTHLLNLKEFRGIRIVSVSEMFEDLRRKSHPQS
jgi:putative PIN family toxin of toxin-antitoxin system